MVICKLCGFQAVDVDTVKKHVEDEHAKQASQLKIDAMRKASKDDADRIRVLEAIKAHTLKFLITDEEDKESVYSFDEALGTASMHSLYQNISQCGYTNCKHDPPDGATVTKVLERQAALRKGLR